MAVKGHIKAYMDKPIADANLISPGGYSFDLQGGGTIAFDFRDSETELDCGANDPRVIRSMFAGLDTDAFPASKMLPALMRFAGPLRELFIYAGEEADYPNREIPKVEQILEFELWFDGDDLRHLPKGRFKTDYIEIDNNGDWATAAFTAGAIAEYNKMLADGGIRAEKREPFSIGPANIAAALAVLEDNGIDRDESKTVLQALGYVLLDEELEDLLWSDDDDDSDGKEGE